MPILDWKNGDPISNPEGYDSCMMMHEDTSYQWCSKKCTQKHHFICQIGGKDIHDTYHLQCIFGSKNKQPFTMTMMSMMA